MGKLQNLSKKYSALNTHESYCSQGSRRFRDRGHFSWEAAPPFSFESNIKSRGSIKQKTCSQNILAYHSASPACFIRELKYHIYDRF